MPKVLYETFLKLYAIFGMQKPYFAFKMTAFSGYEMDPRAVVWPLYMSPYLILLVTAWVLL